MEGRESKLEHCLRLSDKILEDLENPDIPLEKTLQKCKRLARLRNDFTAVDWFTLELHGYNTQELPIGIRESVIGSHAVRSGRNSGTQKDVKTGEDMLLYWIASVPALESELQTDLIALENLKPPSHFAPAPAPGGFGLQETFSWILTTIEKRSKELSKGVTAKKTLLSKIKNAVYTYVMDINLQLRFENITESIFQTTKEQVDKELSKLCPAAMKNFVVAYERLRSSNPEEWSQALSSCRNILKSFADSVFPPQSEKYKKRDGTLLSVTDTAYKNRLLAFLDQKLKSGNRKNLLTARIDDVEKRIHALNDILSQGTHGDMSLIDVNVCVLETYLLLGSLLTLIEGQDSPTAENSPKSTPEPSEKNE